MDISKRVFGSKVSKKTEAILKGLQETGISVDPNEPVSSDNDAQQLGYLGDKTPYVRMWTVVQTSRVSRQKNEKTKRYEWKPIEDISYKVFSINENRNIGNYEELEPMTTPGIQLKYEYEGELQENPYLKPSAGIKSVNSKSEGSLGALRRTTVEFTVHNKEDFERIYLPFFLKPGANVFIDFGWSDTRFNLYNPEGKLHTDDDKTMEKFYSEIVQKNQETIEGGITTTIAGNVTKYDVSVDAQGSFNCTLECVSGNYRLLDKSITDDNDLSFIFDNSIEELILGYYAAFSGVKVPTSDLMNYKESTNLTEEDKKELVKDVLDDTAQSKEVGIIPDISKKSGVFYQDIVDGKKETRTDKESIYISFGLFEDIFLNGFVSEWVTYDDEGKELQREFKAGKPFSPSFTSINSWIRYDVDLYEMQKTKYLRDDRLISFLYPDEWEPGTTYNKVKPLGLYNEKTNPNGWKSTEDDIKKRRIPLRELFIAVPVISEAFSKKENVNDAIEFIFDRIFEDSGNIINIKMVSPNDAQVALTFTDVNVETDRFSAENDKPFEFDLTSGNTIVQNFDLKFETPKAGLSSMIAIGNQDTPSVFSEMELIKFNLLNAVSGIKDKIKYQVKHLPDFGKGPSKKQALTLKLDEVIKAAGEAKNNAPNSSPTFSEKNYQSYLDERKKRIKERDEEQEASTEPETGIEKDYPPETDDGRPILYATSNRDFHMLLAKIKNFIKTGQNSISPVMPLTLSMKLYGNNFLGIGDFFTVNYLPQHFKDRVFFQIVGIDHTIDNSGWVTNYTTVMRLRSTSLYNVSGDKPTDVLQPVVKFHGKLQAIKIDEIIKSNKNSMQNKALGLMTKEVNPGFQKKITTRPSEEKKSFSQTVDFGDMSISEEIVVLNPLENKEKIEKLSKELNSLFLGTPVRIDAFPMSVNLLDNMATSTATSYWAAISELILGDDLINWETIRANTGYKDLYLENYTPVALRGDEFSAGDGLNAGKLNQIYTIPVKDGDDINGKFESVVMNLYDDIVYDTSWLSLGLKGGKAPTWAETTGLDSKQKPIYENMFLNAFGATRKSKQLVYENPVNNGKYLAANNFHLFWSMLWKIPQEGDSEWSVIKINTGAEDAILNNLVIPRQFIQRTGTDMNKTFTKFYANFSAWKNTYKKYFEK